MGTKRADISGFILCSVCSSGDEDGYDEGSGLVVNGGMLEEIEQLCYLGDVLDCEAVVEIAVTQE